MSPWMHSVPTEPRFINSPGAAMLPGFLSVRFWFDFLEDWVILYSRSANGE